MGIPGIDRAAPAGRAVRHACLLALLVTAAALAQPSHERVIAFGDSLVDAGNVFTVHGTLAHKPYAPIPSAPYPIGGPNFGNGETWVQQLARQVGAGPTAGPSTRTPNGKFSNYAFGGARARDVGPAPPLTAQLGLFRRDYPHGAPPSTLYAIAIAIGGNDLRDVVNVASQALQSDPTDLRGAIEAGQGVINDAISVLAAVLPALDDGDQRHFVIAHMPDLSRTPAVAAAPAPVRSLAAVLSAYFNDEPETHVLDMLDEPWRDVVVARVNAFQLTRAVARGELGFDVGARPCLEFGVRGNAICKHRARHFYWDGIHPTRAGHALIADRALTALERTLDAP